jgi:hypothetical protein
MRDLIQNNGIKASAAHFLQKYGKHDRQWQQVIRKVRFYSQQKGHALNIPSGLATPTTTVRPTPELSDTKGGVNAVPEATQASVEQKSSKSSGTKRARTPESTNQSNEKKESPRRQSDRFKKQRKI